MTVPVDLPDWITSIGAPSAVIYDGPLTGNTFDVAQYQSLMIVLYNQDGVSPLVAQYAWQTVGGVFVDQGVLSSDAISGSASFTLPVIAPKLLMSYVAGPAGRAIVIGLAQAADRRALDDYLPFREFGVTVLSGASSGTDTLIPGIGSSVDAAQPDESSYSGLVAIQFQCSPTGGASQFILRAHARTVAGARRNVIAFVTTSNAINLFTTGHPYGYVSWSVQNFGVLTANVVVTLTVTPASVP